MLRRGGKGHVIIRIFSRRYEVVEDIILYSLDYSKWLHNNIIEIIFLTFAI